MNEITLRLENRPADASEIDALFRHAHSLKGMTAAMGYDSMADLAHRLENVLDRVRSRQISFSTTCADLVLEVSDIFEAVVADVETGGPVSRDVAELVLRLAHYPDSHEPAPHKGAEDYPYSGATPASPAAAGDMAPEPSEPRSPAQTVRINSSLLDHLLSIAGEFTTANNRLLNLASDFRLPELAGAVNVLSPLVRELHDKVMQARMMPFGSICAVFPRLIRDLAQKSGKEVTLEIVGKEIGLDRTVLEELQEPLIHILRNAVGHGIEPPSTRTAAGKPGPGHVRIHAFREKAHSVVTVEDDGRGMDPSRIITAAVSKGFISPEKAAAIPAPEALMLICLPGFTMSDRVTEISGRGVGMDAVNTLVHSFGGVFTIESVCGEGSRFTIRIPRNIVVSTVQIVQCGPVIMGLPLSRIQRLVELPPGNTAARKRQLSLAGTDGILPLLDLSEFLGIPSRRSENDSLPIVITEVRGRVAGVIVDRFSGQQEVFVRPLGRPLASLAGLAGSALLGDGRSIYILDMAALNGP